MSDKKNSNFLIQGSILAIASLLVRLIGLLYRIPLIRIIGDDGMGIYNYSFSLYNIALILSSYSLPTAVSKLVASRNATKEYKNSYRVLKIAMLFSIVVGMSATLILYFGADYFAKAISNDPNVALPLRVLSPTIFVFSVMGVLRGYFQGKNTMIPTAVSQIIEQVINAIVSILAAYILVRNYTNTATYGAAGSTLGTFVGALSGLIFLVLVFILYKPVLERQLRRDTTPYAEGYTDIFKLIIITILPIILSQTVYQISSVIDGSLFGHIMAAKEVAGFDKEVLINVLPHQLYTKEYRRVITGIYGSKYILLTNVPVGIASAIGAATVTSISAAKARGMDGAVRRKIHSAIKFNMIIAIPSAVGMGVLAKPIMQLLFADSRNLTANYMRLGSIAVVFFSLSTVSSAILQGIGKLRAPVINSAISLAIHIVLVYVMLKYASLSGYGLVIGNVTFALVASILNWLSIEKYTDYRQEIVKSFIIPAVSAGLMGIAAYLTYEGVYIWSESNAIATLVAIINAVIIYFTLLIFLRGVEEEELESLPNPITRFLHKLHIL